MLKPNQWQTRIVPGIAPNGEAIFSVLAKATFSIRPDRVAQIKDNGIPFCEKEEWVGGTDPLKFPPRCEPDLVPYKLRTDMLIHGRAFAPEGRRARFFDLTLAINDIHYQIRVVGKRYVEPSLTSITFSEPELFDEMPLHYGLAYGGCDQITDPDMPLSYPRNPVGKGFVINPETKDLVGLELPNLENAAQLLTPASLRIGRYDKWTAAPEPRALGLAPKHSAPRNNAQNSSLHIWNAAPPRLCLPSLWGDESITMTYMDRAHPKFTFELPGIVPTAFLNFGKGSQRKYMVLQTVEIFKEMNLMTQVWRAAFPVTNHSNSLSPDQFEFGVQ